MNSIQKDLEISFRVFCSPVFFKVDDQVFDVFKETFEQFIFWTIRWTAGEVSFTVVLLNSEIRIIENVKKKKTLDTFVVEAKNGEHWSMSISTNLKNP